MGDFQFETYGAAVVPSFDSLTKAPLVGQSCFNIWSAAGSSFTHVRTGNSAFSTSFNLPSTGAEELAAPTTTSPAPARVRQHHTALAVSPAAPLGRQPHAQPGPGLTTPPPLVEIRVPTSRGRGVGAARRLPSLGAALGAGPEDVPRLRATNPQLDYEYYDDDADAAPSATKVKIHGDGWIECLDRGNFPHPFSCRKFISCAKMESGDLQGWEYTCPRGLSFDPIGGICNWSAGLGCKA